MTIGFNGLTLSGQRSGVGLYTANLLNALWSVDSVNTYVGWISPDRADDALLQRPNVRLCLAPASIHQPGRGLVWEHLRLPFALRRHRVKVFFSPSHTMPLVRLSNTAMVVTIHDLAFLRYPGTKSRQFRIYMRWMLRHTARSASIIIVDSEHTRHEVIDIFRVPEERIVKIALAASARFTSPVDPEKLRHIRERYRLGDTVILAVGDIEPRKNIPRLIEATARIRQDTYPQIQLVLVGKARRAMDALRRAIEQHRLADAVVFTGYIADEELSALYRLARIFVYPSLYEGFGIPPLEAMMCGTPVVASNASSIPEVVGDAGILVDPHSVESIADGIERALSDSTLIRTLVEKGYRQTRRFSWEATARQTLRVFEAAGQG